jgi:hypothetical protein
MNEEYQEEEFESEHDTSESDYLSEPEGTDISSWDGETHPDQIDNWQSDDDKQAALDFYNENHIEPWNGHSEPKEEQFDDYESYQTAHTRWLVGQELAGRAVGVQQAPEHPADTDPYYIEKQEIFNHIQKYAAEEADARAADDPAKLRDAQRLRKSFEKDLENLEAKHPTPLYTEAIETAKAEYLADVQNAIDNPDEFQQKKAELGADKMFNDATQRLKAVNLDADDSTLYYIHGDSQYNRRTDWSVKKVELPPGVKTQIMRDAEIGGKTHYDQLVQYGYVEPLPPPDLDFDDDKVLEGLSEHEAAEYLPPSKLTRYYELKGIKMNPTYLRI